MNGTLVAYEGRPRWSRDAPSELKGNPNIAAGLAQAYTTAGYEILKYLRGSYALAILIPEHRHAFLAIDRMGIRPLAYGLTKTGFAFGSNALAVTAFPGIDRSLSAQAIHDYLYFHMVPSPETIFQGVSKLPPAHCAIYETGRLTIKRYWTPTFQLSSTPAEKLSSELMSHLEEAIDQQFDSTHSATTGAFLSGGLDSSTVVGLLAKRSNSPVNAYTIGFKAEGYDEIPFARLSAKHYNSPLCEYYVTPKDVADAIGIIAKGYDEPFGNASAVPSYFCARLARDNGSTILMAGDGGDEIFAGNERYVTQQVFSYYEKAPRPIQALLRNTLLSNTLGESFSLIHKARSYVRQAAIPLPDRLNSYNFLRRTPSSDIFDPEFIARVNTVLPDDTQRAEFRLPNHADTLQRMLFLDWKFTLADNDLRKVSRACNLAGIEVRYPMLDDDLIAFSTTIPSTLLIRNHSLRDFYKRSLAGFLPPHTIGKKKHGFGLPFGIWMANDTHLNQLARDSLDRMKQRRILQRRYIDHLVSAQQSEHAAYYGVMIWVIVMLEQWLEQHSLTQ
ncbi:MAG: asparagine synthase [Gammaproteobacteria bacterium]|nr:asparagine synthase [Gammaproteobacteria bacterium]